MYGYNCKGTCGSCYVDNCSFTTGQCKSGCDSANRYYIPPFCKIAIDIPPPPIIDFINETTVRASLPVKEEYRLIPSAYQFVIWKEGETAFNRVGNYVKIFGNVSTMVGYIDHLEPGISYRISCILYVNNDRIPIHGEWKNFTTRCTSTTNFQIEIKNTSLTLEMGQGVADLYSCPSGWYDFVFESVETSSQISKGRLTKLPYEFTSLTPFTVYKITISKGVAIIFSREVRTLDSVPTRVQNLRAILVSNKEVAVKWDPPLHVYRNKPKYEVALKVKTYYGCKSLKVQPPKKDVVSVSTALNSINFPNLTPYTSYTVKVVPYTSYRGPETQTDFTVDQTEIPTAVYSDLKFQNYTLSWDPPRDCTTISGPIIAKIVITGMSKAVANFSTVKQTMKYSLNLINILHGVETYEARVYAIRNYNRMHNEFRYEKLVFTTPPKAPPPVRNLDIYEIDSKTMNVYLRWLEPEPPVNGEIQHYVVSSCYSSCKVVLKIRATEYCKLWDKYVCASVKDQPGNLLTVSAMNVNVSKPSAELSVPVISSAAEPQAPEIFVAEALENGVVNLTWSHPWKTGGRLQKFVISTEMVSSRLRTKIQRSQRGSIYAYPITEYQLRYREQLYLLSSSTYQISIRAVTNTDIYSKKKIVDVQTPLSMGFEGELRMEVCNEDSTILLRIPTVLNETKTSVTNVVIQGPRDCQNYTELNPYLREKVGIKYNETAWSAAMFPTNMYAGKTFTIGDNKLYGSGTNCPLKPTESYVIAVIVLSEEGWMDGEIMVMKTTSIHIGEIPRRHDEAWIIPIAILLVAVTVVFFICRRKRRGFLEKIVPHEEMSLAFNNENLDAKSNSSSVKQIATTAPTSTEKELPSRGSTPHDNGTICTNDTNQTKERMPPVKVKDFEDYVKQAIDSGLLDRQYSTLPRGQTKPWECGKLPQNKLKNRYANLIAYDENRVTLEKLPDDPYSDYINANYIKGYKKEKFYIATQGPKANTIVDFWRMIWQEESCIICMVANLTEGGKAKCEQYWPDIGKKKKYGDITVLNARHTVFADFTFRTLHVTYGDEARKIEHLHYTAWPDHGVPLFTHSVVTYLKKVLATPPGNGPVVVHCSAGVGRTGTIILCDICLRRAAAEGVVDVFSETQAIRSQRANMVDNKQQYLLAHLTLLECLLSVPTSLPCNDLLPIKIKEMKKQLTIQRDSLEKMTWQDEALRPPISQTSLSERNLAKNRFPELVSAKVSRTYLKRYPPTDEDSDYISAVYVDGVRLQNQYIATQLPMPETFSDFWRMVAEYKVELIISLQPPDLNDATCCSMVPAGEFKPVPYMNVRAKELTDFTHYTSQRLILENNSEKPATERQVTILSSTEWKAGRNQDPPADVSLVTLWQAAEKISRGDGPIVVLCHDGVTGCGLYLALSFLLEKMTIERECDVVLAIRAIKRSRHDFVKSLEHMEYLYDAAITYLKYFETYANFT
ncbi:PREDICTED: receptor-type tyrosine-protein phosphatase T-like [Eufriesea mexicana]|uniref:receptor-type tyrosine-protein phosphatase T-like n=1 Tax=Eufriesea mexicana TaxID=516756 RepID=UPI00083BD151|nr:PREDICTED: receptor-type tyrosine-protein phosphatase T-like [Eufriesea mexicana]